MIHRRSLRATTVVALSALALVTAACGGGDSAAVETVELSTTEAPTTTVAPTTTPATTEAPTTTVAETTTTIPAPPVYPLTGVLMTDPAIAARPALVVKIDNAPRARPQTGMNAADIVFEEIVNDNFTRFAFVFQSGASDPVGPIRSGRIQDIDLFGAFNRPLFSWSGGNRTVTDAVRASDLIDIGPNRAAVYFRSRDRKAPHNLYSNTTALWTQAAPDAQPPQQQFQYRSEGDAVQCVPSPGVAASLDSIDVRWEWDAAQGLYTRTMEGKPHMDAASGQVTTNNVVVLAMEYLPGISGSPDAQTIATGEAFVFTAGNYVHGTWSRADRLAPFTLLADDGTPIELTPGRTFVELPRRDHTIPLPAV